EGRLSDPETTPTGATYKLDVSNKGVAADTATIALVIPNGVKVVTATGTGYKGVRADKQGEANVAEGARQDHAPTDKQADTSTHPRAATPAEKLHGSIHWVTRGGRPAGPKDFVEIGGEEKEKPAEGGRGAAPTPPTR